MIVSSLLVAFGLDSWWAGLEQDRALLDELTTVLEEMGHNREHLEEWRAVHQRIADSVEEVMLLRSNAANGHMVAVSDTLLAGTTLMPTTNPSSGGVRMLTNSGRLALIENRELRVALAGWDDFVADVAEDEAAGYRWTLDHLLAWAQLNWAAATYETNRRLNTHFWLNRESGQALPQSDSEVQLTDLYRNFLSNKRAFAENSVREVSNLLEVVDQIIGWIEYEFGETNGSAI